MAGPVVVSPFLLSVFAGVLALGRWTAAADAQAPASTASSAPAADASFRLPVKSLQAVAEAERMEKEARVRETQDFSTREREAVEAIERKQQRTSENLSAQIEYASKRIKALRESISRAEEDLPGLADEVLELEEKAERLEREAERMWDFPDIPQPGGLVYSNRAHAEQLRVEAGIYRARAESRRKHAGSLLSQIQFDNAQIKRLQSGLQQNVGRKFTAEEKYRREIGEARAQIRRSALEAITTEDLLDDPGLLKQFKLGLQLESLVLDFALAADMKEQSYPLDRVLDAVEEELADAEFIKLLEANSTPRQKVP